MQQTLDTFAYLFQRPTKFWSNGAIGISQNLSQNTDKIFKHKKLCKTDDHDYILNIINILTLGISSQQYPSTDSIVVICLKMSTIPFIQSNYTASLQEVVCPVYSWQETPVLCHVLIKILKCILSS